MEKIAPLNSAESWDNSGFQIFLGKHEFHKILICLDITHAVIREAVNYGADLIISHHPMYFNPVKNIISGNPTSDYTIELVKNSISVYSSHTPFDKAETGTNFYLAKLLGLANILFFDEFYENAIGLFGELENAMSVKDFIAEIYKCLNLKKNSIRLIGDSARKVRKIGLCTGAGLSEFETADKLFCDAFITGDLKYHDALSLSEKGKTLIEISHFDTEKFFVDNMARQLEEAFLNKVSIIKTETMENPFCVV